MKTLPRDVGILVGLAILIIFVGQKSVAVVWIVFAVSTPVVALVWLVRTERGLAETLNRVPVLRTIITLFCKLIGEQPPVASRQLREVLLETEEDFLAARADAQWMVRGQSEAISRIFEHLRDTVVLQQRGRSTSRSRPPLASFLFVGPEGVGKRYLACALAKLLFRKANTLVLDLEKMGADPTVAVLGTKGSPGLLPAAVRREPYHVVVLERLELAPPALVDYLIDVFQHGSGIDFATNRSLSYQHCLFVFTTTKGAQALANVPYDAKYKQQFLTKTREILVTEGSLDARLLTPLTDIIYCPAASDLTKAEVITLLFAEECEAHGVRLERLAPEIVVSEVAAIEDQFGFVLAPDQIKAFLRRPLVLATERGKNRMSLRVAPRRNADGK